VANLAFFATIAGANMTVLPLVLTGDMGLAPAVVGSLFAINAGVSLAATLPVAKVADKLGPSNIIVPALLATSAAFAYLPWASHHGYEFVAWRWLCKAWGHASWARHQPPRRRTRCLKTSGRARSHCSASAATSGF